MNGPSGAGAHVASAPDLFPGGAPWLRARARNALRHPVRIGVVAGVVFLVTLLALIVVPAGQRRAAERTPEALRRLDSLPILARSHALERRRVNAMRALDSLRSALVAADSADSADATLPRRAGTAATDTASAQVRELSRLIARAERAPLPATYRDLATARALASDGRLAPLLDLLGDIERLQRAYGAARALDSGYVALTERSRAVGSTLLALARERRSALRGDVPEDTSLLRSRLDTLAREMDATDRQLALTRQVNARAQATLAVARELANVNAPPLAMLIAALALGLALGGATSLALEVAGPRFGGDVDAWRTVAAPIIGTVREDTVADRREAVDRLIGRTLTPFTPGRRMAVIGADAAAVAQLTVAMASAIATSGRSVLAVDTDTGEARCATLLRRPVEPGLTDALARGVAWDDVVQRHIGSHAAPLDVVPPGRSLAFAPGTVAVDAAATALGRLADGYDLTLVTVTPADTPIAEALLAPARVREALMVVELGETVLAGMRRTRERLAARGVTIVGVVVYVAG